MINFTPGREQDASPTIRGFKYQIQLTLLRWLDLAEGEELYLEAGEDVDRVLRAPDSASVERELEQIKARKRNVTLRSPDVLTALANFAAHLKSNPNLLLRFRFTTTALPGRERLSPLGKGAKAIEAWQTLQTARSWTADDDKLHTLIAQLIASASRPEDCPEAPWNALIGIVDGHGVITFANFIARFEWSCGSPSPEDMSVLLVGRLGGLPGDTGPNDPAAEQRYQQLTATLLDILSSNGQKKLTKGLLKATLAKPTLAEHDRARLKLLEDRSASQTALLESLESAVRSLDSREAMPILFGPAANELKAIELSPRFPGPPPLVSAVARRTLVVDELAQKISGKTWLAFHGDYGTGKSHLGFLVAEKCGGAILGVSMRGVSPVAAENGLVSLVGDPTTHAALTTTLPGIVLLDDLPDVEPQSRFETILAHFVKVVHSTGRSIISTNRRPLPSNLGAAFASSLIEQPIPLFSNTDAMELFRAHRVPAEVLTDARISEMNAICGGHPMLLTALARHLLSRPDKPDHALLEAIQASKHREQIDLETARAVIQTVESESCRNLLYRLASARTPLSIGEIRTIAAVDPSLPEPSGCIARLDGLWLRKTADSLFDVSPLATPLDREVPDLTLKALHRELAKLIFRRGRIHPAEFVRAITSFLVAGDEQAAATFLVHGCLNWPNRGSGYAGLGIKKFFPLNRPHSLPPPSELPVRAAQAVTAALDGDDFGPYVARIQQLVQEETPQVAVSAIVAGSMLFLPSLQTIPMKLAVLGALLIERFRGVEGVPKWARLGAREPGGDLHLILPIGCIQSWDDLDAYIELLASLPSGRRVEMKKLPELRENSQLLIFRPLFNREGKLTNNAYARLTQVEDRCVELELNVLGAQAAAGKLVVLGEYDKDVDRLLIEADRAREKFEMDPICLSIVNAIVGQQLYFNNRPLDGLLMLSKALADPSHILGVERANRLVDALSAAWDAEADANPYADELAGMLAGQKLTSSEALCQMHAQVAVVRWSQDRRLDAFQHLETAVVNFFELENRPRTRQLGAGLAHFLHYCSEIVESGVPPSQAADGNAYVGAVPRMFSGVNRQMAEMWKARQGPAMLQWMLGRLAGGLGMSEAASIWTDRAFEAAVEVNSPAALALLCPRAAAVALHSGSWDAAVEAIITHGRATVFVRNMPDKSTALEDSVSFDPFQVPKDRTSAIDAEKISLELLSRLIVSELSGSVLSADEQRRAALGAFTDSLTKVTETSNLPTAWRALAEVLRLSLMDRISDEQFSEALAARPASGLESVQFVAHGLLSLRRDVSLKQSVVSQVSILRQLSGQAPILGILSGEYAQVIGAFWNTAFSNARFRFGSPRQLERDLVNAPASPPLQRAKAILRAVSSDLHVTFSQELRDWLIDSNAQGTST